MTININNFTIRSNDPTLVCSSQRAIFRAESPEAAIAWAERHYALAVDSYWANYETEVREIGGCTPAELAREAVLRGLPPVEPGNVEVARGLAAWGRDECAMMRNV